MKVTDWLTNEELRALTARSNGKGAALVLFNWSLIAITFAAAHWWTNPVTTVAAIVVLGGRQLRLAILMHEAGHNTLFKSSKLNALVGQGEAVRGVCPTGRVVAGRTHTCPG